MNVGYCRDLDYWIIYSCKVVCKNFTQFLAERIFIVFLFQLTLKKIALIHKVSERSGETNLATFASEDNNLCFWQLRL